MATSKPALLSPEEAQIAQVYADATMRGFGRPSPIQVSQALLAAQAADASRAVYGLVLAGLAELVVDPATGLLSVRNEMGEQPFDALVQSLACAEATHARPLA
jgi:hypothetical protein